MTHSNLDNKCLQLISEFIFWVTHNWSLKMIWNKYFKIVINETNLPFIIVYLTLYYYILVLLFQKSVESFFSENLAVMTFSHMYSSNFMGCSLETVFIFLIYLKSYIISNMTRKGSSHYWILGIFQIKIIYYSFMSLKGHTSLWQV